MLTFASSDPRDLLKDDKTAVFEVKITAYSGKAEASETFNVWMNNPLSDEYRHLQL